MNEKLVAYNLSIFDPDDNLGGMGDSACMVMVPFAATLVYASVSPHEDDASATIDIQDDGTDIVTAIDASDHDVPGEWISTHCNGTQTPQVIAAGSKIEIDCNSVAATSRLDITLLFLQGESWG
jgi:hypothetical protein